MLKALGEIGKSDEIKIPNELWMKKTPQERARFASAMFAAGRKAIISSLPKDLSEQEFKKPALFSHLRRASA